jgi:hypothetical protein
MVYQRSLTMICACSAGPCFLRVQLWHSSWWLCEFDCQLRCVKIFISMLGLLYLGNSNRSKMVRRFDAHCSGETQYLIYCALNSQFVDLSELILFLFYISLYSSHEWSSFSLSAAVVANWEGSVTNRSQSSIRFVNGDSRDLERPTRSLFIASSLTLLKYWAM